MPSDSFSVDDAMARASRGVRIFRTLPYSVQEAIFVMLRERAKPASHDSRGDETPSDETLLWDLCAACHYDVVPPPGDDDLSFRSLLRYMD